MENENLVYWRGRPVGIEANGRITWFVGATTEAIAILSGRGANRKSCWNDAR